MPGLDAFVQGVLAEDGVRDKKKRPSMDNFMGQTLGGAGADMAPALSNIAPPLEMVYNPQTDVAAQAPEPPESMPEAPTFHQPGILERAARGAAMLGTDIVGGLRQGAAGVVNWAKPSAMETEHLAWLRDLPEDALQEALRSGQISWQDTRYALLPPDARREDLDRAIQFRNAIAEGVGSVADAISPEPSPEKAARQYVPPAPQDPVRQAVQGIARAVPGAAAMIGASAMGVPSPAVMAANVVAAQNAANEAVYNARMADGAEHPEAYQAATGASQIPQMATNLATTLAMLGAGRVLPMTVGGNVSPYVTQGLRTAAQMGAAAAGDAANSAIQDVRSGRDVDVSAAGTAGLQGLLQAGLFGLYNTARDWKKLQSLQGTHRQINETVRKINIAMEDLGLPKVNRQYGVGDASSMLSNSLRAGLFTPDRVFEALTKAGFDPAEVGALVRRGAPAQRGGPALHGAALPEQGSVPPVPAPTGQGGSGAAYAQQVMPTLAPAGQLEQVLSAVRGAGRQNARIPDLMRSSAGQPVQLPMLPSSGEREQNVLGKRDSIREVLSAVRTEQGAKNPERVWVDYARVTPEEAQRLSESTGLNIDDRYVHSLVGESVIHSGNRHGGRTEKRSDQLPITDADYEMIPEVIRSPDSITRGTGKTRRGLDTIVYTKKVNGHVLIVEEVRSKRGKLTFHTLRKSRPGYVYDTALPGHPIVKEKARPEGVTSETSSNPKLEAPNAPDLEAAASPSTSETLPTPSEPVGAMPPFDSTLPPSKAGVKTETPAAQPKVEMRGPKGKRAEPFHANISIPARSKTHHFVTEQSRDSYSHKINILRRDDYTDSEGRSRVKFVNVGSYSPLTGEFSGNVAKGSDRTILGKLRRQFLEQMEVASPGAQVQEPSPAMLEASPTASGPDVAEPVHAEQILQQLEQPPREEQEMPRAATQEEVPRGIPADAKLRRGEMTVRYNAKDFSVEVSPWEKYGKRRLYLKEKGNGKTLGHYDVARGEFGNDFKDSAWSDAVKEQFLRQAGDWYEGGRRSAETQARADTDASRRREAASLFPRSAALKKGTISVEFQKGNPETLEVSPWERNGRRLYINEPWFHGRRGNTVMYYDVDAGVFAGEATDYNPQYREAVKAVFLKNIRSFRHGTEDAPYTGKLRKEADARLASVAEIALGLDEGEGPGIVSSFPEATRDSLYREVLKSDWESDFKKSREIARNVMGRIRELAGEKTPDLEMMREPRSVRQSEEYEFVDPKTWPEGPARDEALALEAWQNLETNEGIETWPESPEKTEALALRKEYGEIEAWIENLSREEFEQRLRSNDPEFVQKNDRGVDIEERLNALRRALRKKKPKNIEKRLSQLIEAEIDAAQEETLAAQDVEEYYHERRPRAENIRRGQAAMEKVIAEHTDVMDAMHRDDLGSISFLWGEPGHGDKFKGGWGVSHLIARRNAQGYDGEAVARKMVEVIGKGKITKRYAEDSVDQERVNVTYDGYEAHLGLFRYGKRMTWLITGYEVTKKAPDVPGEGSGSSGTMLLADIPRTDEEGAGASDNSKPYLYEKGKTENNRREDAPVSVMDVTRRVREMFPLRHGLGSVPQGKRRGILGVFNRRSEVIRTKYRNNLPVIMHELGHALDKELKLRARIPEEALTELLRAGAPVSGEDYTPNQIANEGIAEFVRTYTISRKEGREEFPKFTPVFEKALHENPNVLKNFEEVRKTLEVYYKQDAKARILDKGPNTRGWSPATLKEKIKQLGHDFYTTWVDSNHELSRVSERVRETLSLDVLPDELNLYAAAQNSAGYMAAADKSVAKLLDVVKEHRMTPKDRSDLEAYMKAARALDYRSNGLLPGLGTTEAEEHDIVEKQTPKHIREVAQQLHDAYEEIVQETLVDTGLMAQKTFDMLKEKWPNYVPFIRTDSEAHEDADVKDFLRGRTRSLVNIQSPIKKAKGVADEQEVMPVEEPLLHMLNNVVRYHHMAAKQGVAEVIREISKREGCGWIAERLEGHPAHSDDSTFYIWENGKQVYYATDPAIHKVLKGLNQGSVLQRSLVGRLLSLPSETLKMGATRYNPAFIITNALRDAAQVSVTSRSWAPPLAHTIKGVMMLYSGKRGGKWKELVDEAINEQVFYSGITDIVNSSPGELKRALRKAFNSGGRLSKAWDAFRDAAEKVGAINEYIEVAPKLSEYYHLTRERGVPKREAARQAREANLDFQRAGTWGRGANSVIAFFNAGVQGTDKILRAFREHPGQSMAKAFLYITLPSILAWALAHKDEKTAEEYRQISKWKKDLAWCVKLGGKWWSIPKPPVLGQVFGSLTERVLDAAFDKDAASMRGFSNTLVDQAVPNLMPTVFLPALEAYVNYNFFRDQPVVPRGKEKLPPELQYGPGTSGLAKWVGEKTGQSPYKIDHLIRGYAGTVGGELSKAPDRLFNDGNMPEEYWTEKPFIRSFFIDPSRTNESIERFYELATRTETAKNGYLARRKAGETGKADREVMLAKMFQKVKQDLSEINGAIAAVQEDKGLPPSQKRKRINDLRGKAILAAKWALVQYDRHRD